MKEEFKESEYVNGTTFIAYQGDELNPFDVINELRKIRPNDYVVKDYIRKNVVFAKLVTNNCHLMQMDPLPYNYGVIPIFVSGYDINDMVKVYLNLDNSFNEKTIKKDYYAESHILLRELYEKHGVGLFNELKGKLDFCTAIWDEVTNSFIIGVTKQSNQYNHLYYGYTKEKKELMCSNSESILRRFCNDVKNMDDYSYMINGKIYHLESKELSKINDNFIVEENNKDVLELLLMVRESIYKFRISRTNLNEIDYESISEIPIEIPIEKLLSSKIVEQLKEIDANTLIELKSELIKEPSKKLILRGY